MPTTRVETSYVLPLEIFIILEFLEKMSKFTGLKITNTHEFNFIVIGKGDFQLPHVDYDGLYDFQFQILFYFNKNWPKGDPGGTYLATDEDESTLFFEPSNLDNSMICFKEEPNAWHGTRYITKDVHRKAFLISLK